jgi:hypothetical protein
MNNLKEIDFEKYITNYLVSENGYILRGADENGVPSIGCGHEPDAPDCFHPPAGHVFGADNGMETAAIIGPGKGNFLEKKKALGTHPGTKKL